MRALDRRLLRTVGAARWHVLRTSALGLVGAAATIVQAVFLARLLAGVTVTGRADALAGPAVGALLSALAVRIAAAWAQERWAQRSASRVITDLRRALLTRVAELGSQRLGGRSTELTTLATRGLDGLTDYLVRYLPQLLQTAVVPVAVLAVIAVYDTVSAVLLLLVLPLVPVFMVLIGLATHQEADRRVRSLQRLGAQLLDLIAGLPTLRALGRHQRQGERVRVTADTYRRMTMQTLRTAFLSSFVLELLASLSVAVVAVGIGLRLVDGQMELGTGLVVLMLAPEVLWPLRQLAATRHAGAEGLAALDQAMTWLDESPPATPGVLAPSLERDEVVALEDVTVWHAERALAAPEKLSLSARGGRLLVLTGPNGSGKSSAVAVMMGLRQPDAGRIRVQAHGSDERPPAVEHFQAGVAWLPQRPVVIPGSLADNLRLYAPAADETELAAAAAATGLDEVVAHREWSIALGSDGSGLSAGERERLALARVWLRVRTGAHLVVLDEPTAHLDGPHRKRVLDLVLGWCRDGVAVVAVTHDPALVAAADDVVALPSADEADDADEAVVPAVVVPAAVVAT